jgi:hypothetical protein
LYLDLFYNDEPVEDGEEFSMTTFDTAGLAFVAEAMEDGNLVCDRITWAAYPDGIVALSANTGGTVTITPVSNGTVTITVTAPSEKYEDEVVEFTIRVTKGVGPNVIFQWNAIDEPWVARNSGTNTVSSNWSPAKADEFMSQANGQRAQTVQIFRHLGHQTTTVSLPADPANGGFILGAANGADQPLFTIGQRNIARTTASDTFETDFDGQIDLLRKKVRLTIEYANVVKPTNVRNILQILVNNNSNSSANSMFGASSSLKTYAVNHSTLPNIDGSAVDTAREKHTHNDITNTGRIELIIDTRTGIESENGFGTAFNGHDNEAALRNAFISFYAQNANEAGNPVNITITSILLEYIDSDPAPGTVGLDVQEGDVNIPAGGITLVNPDNASKTLNAITTPAADSVSWVVTNENIATVSSATGNSVTITAGNNGTTTLTVTARKAGYITNVKRFNITVSGEGQVIVPQLLLHNNATVPGTGNGSGTTTNLAAAWNDDTKRYTIVNTFTSGGFAAGGITNSTFVYLNTSLSGVSSIKARVRITNHTGSATGSGVIMGMINDPVVGTASTHLQLAGIRISSNAQVRNFVTQTSDTQNNAGNIGTALNAVDYDDEYIIEVSRSGNSYTMTVWNLMEDTPALRTGTRSDVVPLGDSVYLGFIVSRATVEISQITITGAPLTEPFTTPASTPAVYTPTGVRFTAPTGITGTFPNFEYSHDKDAGNLTLTAAVVYANAPQNISWAITSGDATFESTPTGSSATLVFEPTADEVVVTATAIGTGLVATLTIEVTDGGGGGVIIPNDWSWSFNRATWTNRTGASTNFVLNDKDVRLWNSTGAAHADKDGFIFDGMSANVKRFMIGSQSQTVTTSSAGDPAGQFDFSTNHGKRVQIAVEFEVLEKGDTPGTFRLAINNNHGTAAANSLQLSPTSAWLQQIDLVPLDVGHSGTIGGIFDPATAELNTSSTLTVEALRTVHLANSFISLSLPANSSRILIKSVSVTYIEPDDGGGITPPPTPTGITISGTNVQPGTPKTLEMDVGQAPVTLIATRIPGGSAGGTIAWSSNNTAAVTVNSTTGQITAVAAGTATITATLTGVTGAPFTDTVLVTVKAPPGTGNVDININPEANFTGFPTTQFALSKSAAAGNLATLLITLTGYEAAQWFINGAPQAGTGNTFTVDAAVLDVRNSHNLTVVVTAANGELYSRSVTFSVTQ